MRVVRYIGFASLDWVADSLFSLEGDLLPGPATLLHTAARSLMVHTCFRYILDRHVATYQLVNTSFTLYS